jgi:hypothetical protein
MNALSWNMPTTLRQSLPVELIMKDAFSDKLSALRFTLPKGHTPPSEALVREFERRFDVNCLPTSGRF